MQSKVLVYTLVDKSVQTEIYKSYRFSCVRIIQLICQYYEMNVQCSTRKHDISHPRHIAMWLMKKYYDISWVEIARYFNCHHSTVIYGFEHVTNAIWNDQPLGKEALEIEKQFLSTFFKN